MVPGNRFAAFLLVPICLFGRFADCALSGDLFPSFEALAEQRRAVWPSAALVDAPLPLEEAGAPQEGYPALETEQPRAFPPPPAEVFPPQGDDLPTMQLDSAPFGSITADCPAAGEIWVHPDPLPARRGVFSRQPLRQRLRELYGPPQGRHRGLGQPLTNESWLYRPFNAGWFIGALFGTPMIDGWLGFSSGYLTGFRFGWDQDHYWGLDMQFAYGQSGPWDLDKSYLAQPNELELQQLLDARRDLDMYQWATSIVYYPWGDARWRPYLSFGIGAARMRFTDPFLVQYDEIFFVLPLALGMKYHWNDCLAMRLECSDSFSIPGRGGLRAVHNLSINYALEIRFGGGRTAYWPWNPGKSYW